MSAGGRGGPGEQGQRRCAPAAPPAPRSTSSARCGSAQPPTLAHGNRSNPTVPLCPASLQTSPTPARWARLKPAQLSRWEIKAPLSPPPPACARVGCLLDENLERNEGNSAFLSACVQQLERQERLAVLQAECPSHPPAAGSGSPARLPLDGHWGNRALGMASEWEQS